MRPRLATALTAAIALATIAVAPAAAKVNPWPPKKGPGKLFVHYGEEHVNDADGATLLPKVVRVSARYRPRLVTLSGDKADDGEPEQFELWSEVMEIYDRKGIPWFAGVGNHDRKAPPGVSGGVSFIADFGPYREFFADRPYPMGDGEAYEDRRLRPRRRPAADPDGAASHYFADYGSVRWVFIDNSCWSIVACDPLQTPSGQSPQGEAQLNFLRRVGAEAAREEMLTFVVMHMPTRDPGDQGHREPIALQHTMGKTVLGVLDNTQFEQAAQQAGVDGVFVGHIKGQLLYRGRGGIPYFIDGGAGGELYTTGPVGVDHGYWHGFRLIRVRGDGFSTDAVPIFVRKGITIAGGRRLTVGERRTFEAFGRQPVFNDPAKVEALELRDPDPIPPQGLGGSAWIGDVVRWGAPLASLAVVALFAAVAGDPRRRRLALAPVAVVVAGLGVGGVSLAQQSVPDSTPVESLPNPARIWTSSNPQVLRPIASESDDDRRRAQTQTADGRFRALCPGRAKLRITSGFETARRRLRIGSHPGQIVRKVRPGASIVDRGQVAKLATVELKQPARVLARITRGGHRVATLHRACRRGPGLVPIKWNGLRHGRDLAPGGYDLRITVRSDRRPLKRRFALELN